MIQIRPATKQDVIDRFGNVPKTMKALVADLDGKIVGFCGIAQIGNMSELFSYTDDEVLPYKKTILKAAKKVMEKAPSVVVARSDPRFEGKLLRHLGFKKIDHPDNNPPEEWYIWAKSWHS